MADPLLGSRNVYRTRVRHFVYVIFVSRHVYRAPVRHIVYVTSAIFFTSRPPFCLRHTLLLIVAYSKHVTILYFFSFIKFYRSANWFPLLAFNVWLQLSGMNCVACGRVSSASPNIKVTIFGVSVSGGLRNPLCRCQWKETGR
jgi:hypothetical protein